MEQTAILLELLASRICHDLISPVGAVNNGVEFIQETGEAGPEAIDLIAMSAHEAAGRLQMFRLAYGAGGRDPSIKPEDIHKHFHALISGEAHQAHPVTLEWDPHAPLGFDERPTGYCKTLAGALMLSHECIPKGGQITVTAGGTNETHITATGKDALPRMDVDKALARNIALDNLDPRLIHPYALSVLADSYGLEIAIKNVGEDSVTLSLKSK